MLKSQTIIILLISTISSWKNSNSMLQNFITETQTIKINKNLQSLLKTHLNYELNNSASIPEILNEILFTDLRNCKTSFENKPEKKELQILLEKILLSNFEDIYKKDFLNEKLFTKFFKNFNIYYFKTLFSKIQDYNLEDLNLIEFPNEIIKEAVLKQNQGDLYSEKIEEITNKIISIEKKVLDSDLFFYKEIINMRIGSLDSIFNFLEEWIFKIIKVENLDENETIGFLYDYFTLEKMKVLLKSFSYFFSVHRLEDLEILDFFVRIIISKKENFILSNNLKFFNSLLQICFDIYAERDEIPILHQGIKLFIEFFLPNLNLEKKSRDLVLNDFSSIKLSKSFDLIQKTVTSGVEKTNVQIIVMDYFRFLSSKENLNEKNLDFSEIKKIFKNLSYFSNFKKERLMILDNNNILFETDNENMLQNASYKILYETLVNSISEILEDDLKNKINNNNFSIFFNQYLDLAYEKRILSKFYNSNMIQYYVSFKLLNYWIFRKNYENNDINLIYRKEEKKIKVIQLKMEFFKLNDNVKLFIDSLAADTLNHNKTADFNFFLGKTFNCMDLKKKIRKLGIDLILI